MKNRESLSDAQATRPRSAGPDSGGNASSPRTGISLKPIFAWYDLWVGASWDAAKRRLYIFPVPMLGVVIQFPPKRITWDDVARLHQKYSE